MFKSVDPNQTLKISNLQTNKQFHTDFDSELQHLFDYTLRSHPVPKSLFISDVLKSESVHIREVWNDNLEEEFALIRGDDYPYIALDTEFPGVVLRPLAQFKNTNDGNLPTYGTDKSCIWLFNFRMFNVTEYIFANDSIEMLRQCGIDFKKNSVIGIYREKIGGCSDFKVVVDGGGWSPTVMMGLMVVG
ncbi:putative poly(A)-specific ribonuclease [Helianthus anomalus]